GLRSLRRQTGWYLQGFPVGPELRREFALVSSLAGLDWLLDRLDPSAELPPGARRLKRGHTDGPRPVHVPDGWFDLADDPTPPVGAEVLVSGG
nr:tRNA dihydrouridine synthase DusB [Acidimicrobiia bacterium]